ARRPPPHRRGGHRDRHLPRRPVPAVRAAGAPACRRHGVKRLAVAGFVATLAAMVATTVVAALARSAGVDFEVSEGEVIPVSGVTVVTGFLSLVGVII